MVSETGVRFTGGAEYKESTRHYYEIAHQEYLRAIERDLQRLESMERASLTPVGAR
jgi:hypothetical protein